MINKKNTKYNGIYQKSDLPKIPESWIWTRLVNICQYLPTGVEKYDGKIGYYSTGSIKNNYYTPEGAYSFLNRPSRANRMAKNGDVFQARMAGTNKALLIGEKLDEKLFSTGFIQLRPFNCCISMSSYIYCYIKSFNFLKHRDMFATGSTQIALTDNAAKNIYFPLAPLPEQHRIVTKIEELFTKLDTGVELLKKVKKQLKCYRQLVLKYAFEGKLTEEWRKIHKNELEPALILLKKIKDEHKKSIKEKRRKYKGLLPLNTSNLPKLPNSWIWIILKEIGTIITGTTPSKAKKEYYGNDFLFFKPTDLNNGYYVKNSKDRLSKEGIQHARLLPKKSTLVTCIGATIGKTGFIRIPGASNQQINAIIPDHNVIPEFVYFVCISPQFQKYIKNNASATTLPILNKTKFEFLFFPFPTILEQSIIVEKIESKFSVADEVEKIAEQSLKQAEKLRQSILKRAFEGKLVPQDPNNESASILLEKIKKEKARIEAEKKAKKVNQKKKTKVDPRQGRLL